MGVKIGALFLIVLAIGAVVFFYQSGDVGKAYQSLTHFAPLSASSSSFSSYFPRFPSSGSLNNGVPAPPPPAYQGTTIAPYPTSSAQEPQINPSDIPTGFTVSQLSPYFHQVRFSTVFAGSPLGAYYGSYGQISLYASNVPATGANVTGWHIVAHHGGEYIPQAVLYYDPAGLAVPQDIVLKYGDTLNIYSTSAPVNLRLNECIGYLPNKSQFNPPLPVSCPYMGNNAEIQSFSGACQNYIYSLGSCTIPNLNDFRVPTNDYACRSYLSSHFNYKSCYDEHFTDTNFLSHEVRVWAGSSPVDSAHDQVELLDKNGLLVDFYSY